jgi:hypothetical protein
MVWYSEHKSDKHEFGTEFYISRPIIDNLKYFVSVMKEFVKLWSNLNIAI